MPLPFRQQDLADSPGLSLVHTNETLARLRERQVAQWGDNEVRIRDLRELARIAAVDIEAPVIRPLL